MKTPTQCRTFWGARVTVHVHPPAHPDQGFDTEMEVSHACALNEGHVIAHVCACSHQLQRAQRPLTTTGTMGQVGS